MTKALRVGGGGDYTVHGFRSAFRDWAAADTGFADPWAEAALAHSNPNKTEAAYRRTTYFDHPEMSTNGGNFYVSLVSSRGDILTEQPMVAERRVALGFKVALASRDIPNQLPCALHEVSVGGACRLQVPAVGIRPKGGVRNVDKRLLVLVLQSRKFGVESVVLGFAFS